MGLGCTYPDPRRETGTCDRSAAAVYESVTDDQPRCRRHDGPEVARFAATAGYLRHAIVDGRRVADLGSRLLGDAKAAILQAVATAPSADGWVDA